MKFIRLCTLLIFPLVSMHLFADVGETGTSFLNLGVGAHALAMGGAVTSHSSGVHALFWNPGGLGWLNGTEATVMHSEYFQSIRYEYIGIAHRVKSFRIGFSLKGLYLGDMEERSGPSENPLSTFGAHFVAPSFSLATLLNSKISLGTSMKLIYQKIGDDNAVAFGDDIGISIKNGIPGLSAGLAVTNLGSKVTFVNSSYALPTRLKMGLSYSLFSEKLLVAFDVVKPFKEDFEFCFGFEGTVIERLCLRAGYRSGFHNTGSFAGAAAGIGFKFKDFDIDYAFSTYGVLGLTHNFSISYIFGRVKRIGQREERRIADELRRRARMTAETFYRQGLAQQGEGNYDDALRSFDIALIWDPQYEDALKSVAELKKMVRERMANEHLTKGIGDFNEGNYIDAISEFGRVLEIEPTNELARGWLKAASDVLVKIQMERIQLEENVGAKISEYFKRGLQKFSEEEYGAAIEEWNKILAIDPTHQTALQYVRKAESGIREQIDRLLTRVELYVSQNKWTQALHEVNRVLALDPGNSDGLSKKDAIQRTLKNLSAMHTRKGIQYYEEGKFGLAETELKMAINFDASNAEALNYLTKTQFKEKAVSGGDIDELYMRGVNAYTREDYEMAIFYWRRVVDVDPHHVNAKRNIERAEEKLKIYKQ
ncbi:MAG: PorV/PorQ family protein [candidate division WOR-3 bacterium]|nr:MAG: PorV/PorQ family protein [candidate division WOR-3 bacterium]